MEPAFGSACLYGADGVLKCPLQHQQSSMTQHKQQQQRLFVHEPFVAFVGEFDSPQNYVPIDMIAAMDARGAATGMQTVSAAAIVQARSSGKLATNAAAAQQADWGAVQGQAANAAAQANSQYSGQMASELAFVSAEQAADNQFAASVA